MSGLSVAALDLRLSACRMRRAREASLRRLGTGHIGLCQLRHLGAGIFPRSPTGMGRLSGVRRQAAEGRRAGRISPSPTRFLVTALAFVVARLWSGVRSNAGDPGRVPTRMGGPPAPADPGRAE